MMQTSKMSSIPTRIPQQHSQHHTGNPAYGNGQPSKLQMMQIQMQQRHLKEKEEKMMEYRNQNQNNSYLRRDIYHPEQVYDDPNETGTVRKFFQERRELSNQNEHLPNINHHYKKVKGSTYQYQAQGHSPQGQVRSYGAIHKQREMNYGGRPPLPMKNSAGRDKAYPLAPIERTPKQTPHGSRQSSRRSSAQSSNSRVNSFGAKSKFSRPRGGDPVPYESDAENYHTEDSGMLSNRSNSPKKKSTSFKEWQEKQKRIRQASAGQTNNDHSSVQNGVPHTSDYPLTDFEKWQMEQDANKQMRLQKHREQNANQNNDHDSGVATSRSDYAAKAPSPAKPKMSRTFSPQTMKDEKMKQKKMLLNRRINSRKNMPPSPSEDSAESDFGEGVEISQKQRELEEMIKRQQAELLRIQHEREAEEERERKEREKRAKRAAEQRERQRKQREAEERERKEAAERERKQREMEQQMEDERLARMRARESPKISSRYEYVDSDPEQDHGVKHRTPDPPFPKKAARPSRSRKQERPPPAKRQPAPPPAQTYEPEPEIHNSRATFYEQAAAEAEFARVDLATCKVCGRKFARDRLAQHTKICKDAGKKKRKVFDPVKMRTDGTEAAKYVNTRKRKPSPKPKKSNWRQQHENFIKTIRYAKAVTDAEKEGGNLAGLPPPPVTENPDYEQCPYCERKFNPSTAERHIPRCKDIKSRPAPPRARRK